MVLKLSKSQPSGTVISQPSSASVHVLRNRLQKVYSQAQTDFSYNTTTQIMLDVNSSSDFWDPISSYIRMKVSVSLLNDEKDDPNKYLSEGGVHSIFKSIEIYTKSGTLIERVDSQNILYSMIDTCTKNSRMVEQSGFYYGDSVYPSQPLDQYITPFSPSSNIGAYVFTAASRTLSVLGGIAGVELKVGDKVTLRTGNVNYISTVESAPNVNSVVLLGHVPGDVAAGNVQSVIIEPLVSNLALSSARSRVANTADQIVCFQPFSSFLMNGNLIPLFLMRGGLRIVLTLDRPEFCIVSSSKPSGVGFSGANIIVRQPEYICSFLTPDQSLSEAYLQMFNQNMIHVFFSGFKTFRNIIAGGDATTASLSHNTNVRSGKFMITRIQDARARTVTAADTAQYSSTYTCDSIAQGLSAGLRQYSLQTGSDIFPQSEPLDFGVSNIAGPTFLYPNYHEAAVEMSRVFSTLGASIGAFRCAPDDWCERPVHRRILESGFRADSQRLVLGALLARDPSPFSGMDLSLNVLNEIFVFSRAYTNGLANAAGTDRHIVSMLAYDSVVTIGSSGVIVQS